jgi:hypothetical protein
MSRSHSSFSLFNKKNTSNTRSLQTIVDNNTSNNTRNKNTSPRTKRDFSRESFNNDKQSFGNRFGSRNSSETRKQLIFNTIPKKNESPGTINKTKILNQPRKVFRSKFDAINETQDRKPLIFGKKPKRESELSEPSKFREMIIDPTTSRNNIEYQSVKKVKKKTEVEIYREFLKKIEGKDSWDLRDDPNITKFVLGHSVIEFTNLTPEQFKFYQEVVQLANRSIDKHTNEKKNKEIENIDPQFKYKHSIIDKLWRNRDLPIQSWDYVLIIIEKMDYDYTKFIKEYIDSNSDEQYIHSQLRNIKKKLKKIQILEKKLKNGSNINNDQKSSIDSKTHYLLKQSIYEGWLSWMNDESDDESDEESE